MNAEIAEDRTQSFLMWTLQSMGFAGVLVALAAAVAFGLTVLVVCRGKGPTSGTALLFIVPFPVVVSIFTTLKGMVASFSVIAVSDVQLKASDVAAGVSESLLTLIEALLLSFPSYIAAVIFLVQRSLKSESSRHTPSEN